MFVESITPHSDSEEEEDVDCEEEDYDRFKTICTDVPFKCGGGGGGDGDGAPYEAKEVHECGMAATDRDTGWRCDVCRGGGWGLGRQTQNF